MHGTAKAAAGTKAAIFFFCAVVVLGSGLAHADAAGTERSKASSLSEIVLFGLRPVQTLKTSGATEAQRACIRMYFEALPPQSPLRRIRLPSGPEQAVVLRRRNLEEQMVVLFGEKVRREAAAFAGAVPLAGEWEGFSEGPLTEAEFAAQWLRRRDGSPIADFLHLFMAHRLRAGCEAARFGREKEDRPDLARRYAEALARARASGNPLIVCIAEDLEAQPHVYLEGQDRP